MKDLKTNVEEFIESQKRKQQEKLILEAKLEVAKEDLDEAKTELEKSGFSNIKELDDAKEKIEKELEDILQKAGM